MANALLEELDLAADAVAELELLAAELEADETAEEAEAAAEDTLLLADEATLETELLPFAAAREPRARRMSVRNCIVMFEVVFWLILRGVFVDLEM